MYHPLTAAPIAVVAQTSVAVLTGPIESGSARDKWMSLEELEMVAFVGSVLIRKPSDI